MSLSALKRLSWLVQSEQRMADLVVIGSGITGASIALDAVSRGIHTLIIEEKDVQSNRNGRSTSFLSHTLSLAMDGNWKLLKQIRREQQIIARNAPYLIQPVSVYIPTRQTDKDSNQASQHRTPFYDWISSIGSGERLNKLTFAEAIETEPMLAYHQLQGARIFNTYDVDEVRLTMEILKTAVEHGTYLLNYCQVERYLYERNQIVGVVVRDRLGGRSFRIRARSVINASGVQMPSFLQKDNEQPQGPLTLQKYTQLIVPSSRIPLKQAFYETNQHLLNQDERLTILPRGELTMISTCSDVIIDEPSSVEITLHDRDELLHQVNKRFPAARLKPEDIQSGGIGLRLQTSYKPAPLSLADTQYTQTQSGLISIIGEPLWGYRQLAEQVVALATEQIFKHIGKNFPATRTAVLPLCGTNHYPYQLLMNEQLEAIEEQQMDSDLALEWTTRYGEHADRLFAHMQAADWNSLSARFKVLDLKQYMELYYAVHEEMVIIPSDYIERKLITAPEPIVSIKHWTSDIVEAMSLWIDWSASRKEALKMQAFDTAERLISCYNPEGSFS